MIKDRKWEPGPPTPNPGCLCTVKFTTPMNSCPSLTTCSSMTWRSLSNCSLKCTGVSTGGRPRKLSSMADRRGDVVGLMVERAAGTHNRLPVIQRSPMVTSWRFGNLEKSKDRLRPSLPSEPRSCERQYSPGTTRGTRRGGIYRRFGPSK